MITKLVYGKDGQNFLTYAEYLASTISDITGTFISSTPGDIVYLPGMSEKFIMKDNIWHPFKTNKQYKSNIVQPART